MTPSSLELVSGSSWPTPAEGGSLGDVEGNSSRDVEGRRAGSLMGVVEGRRAFAFACSHALVAALQLMVSGFVFASEGGSSRGVVEGHRRWASRVV